ncbi:MAG: tetratricopeptide repeat protein [Bryobacteraceae bacterium]
MKAEKQHFKRAKALHQAGHLQEAEAIYLRLLDQNPGDVEGLHLLALLHADTNRIDTSVQLLRAAIGIEGPRPWLCRNLGIVLERSGDRAAALACYRQALMEAPGDHELWAATATLLAADNRHGEAAGAWHKALESAPCTAEWDMRYRLPWANALALAGERGAAVAQYDRVLQRDPSNVEATFHRAVAYMQENEADTAVSGFRRTLELAPNHARAANNLGILYQLEKDYPRAIEQYRVAIREDRSFPAAIYNLGSAWNEFGRPRQAIAVFRKVLHLQPENTSAWTNLGNAWLACNQTQAALDCYRRTLAITPGDASAEWNTGIVALLTGDLQAGWKGYERRFDVKGSPVRRPFAAPQWRGEPLRGKTLLLHAEQGLGDTLQFIRYAPVFAAQGARVVVECQGALLPLLAGSNGVSEWFAAQRPAPGKNQSAPVDHLPFTDYQLPLLSAPALAETTLDSIPSSNGYLHAPVEAAKRWEKWLRRPGRGLRVGICWAGNPNHKNDRNRSIPPELLSELEAAVGVEWINLQKGHRMASSLEMRNAARELGDFADTAGLIENLDLVISVDTSVAHLAGALGKPVWVLLPFAPDWRWLLDRSDSPWYAGARLFRQAETGKWRRVLERVAVEVTRLASGKLNANGAILEH